MDWIDVDQNRVEQWWAVKLNISVLQNTMDFFIGRAIVSLYECLLHEFCYKHENSYSNESCLIRHGLNY